MSGISFLINVYKKNIRYLVQNLFSIGFDKEQKIKKMSKRKEKVKKNYKAINSWI